MTEEEKQKIKDRANEAFGLVCRLANEGEKAFRMSIPPQRDDSDVLLCEVIANVNDLLRYVAILESENRSLINNIAAQQGTPPDRASACNSQPENANQSTL